MRRSFRSVIAIVILGMLAESSLLACEGIKITADRAQTPSIAAPALTPPASPIPPAPTLWQPTPVSATPPTSPTRLSPTPMPTPISWIGPLLALPDLSILDLGAWEVYPPLQNEWIDTVWSWSPDGCRLLFKTAQDVRIVDIGTNRTTILISQEDERAGASPKPLSMEWSPTGEWIAYTTAVSTSYEVFLIRADGSDQTRLTRDNYPDLSIDSWSPDGQKLFVWGDPEGTMELSTLEISTLQRQVILRFPHFIESWEDIFIADIRSGERVPIQGLPDLEEAKSVWVAPSPDFHYYAISIGWDEGMGSMWDSRLYMLDIYTGEVREISEKELALFNLSWSPDSTTIALAAMEFDDYSTETTRIYLIQASTGKPIDMLDTSELGREGAALPSWSSDGGMLAFVTSDGMDLYLTIYSFNSKGFIEGQPLKYSGRTPPLWSPRQEYDQDACR